MHSSIYFFFSGINTQNRKRSKEFQLKIHTFFDFFFSGINTQNQKSEIWYTSCFNECNGLILSFTFDGPMSKSSTGIDKLSS